MLPYVDAVFAFNPQVRKLILDVKAGGSGVVLHYLLRALVQSPCVQSLPALGAVSAVESSLYSKVRMRVDLAGQMAGYLAAVLDTRLVQAKTVPSFSYQALFSKQAQQLQRGSCRGSLVQQLQQRAQQPGVCHLVVDDVLTSGSSLLRHVVALPPGPVRVLTLAVTQQKKK
ncbi:MAG: hypothetical protein OXT67_05930 [Zetaproteobacteria bacterium]|nr:hypothetical protein [Zetaproteobacteria bacterium]